MYTFYNIKKMLSSIAFYSDKINLYDSFDKLPIIEKCDVKKNLSKFFNKKFEKNEINDYTSGSTGMPLNVKWYKSDYIRSILCTWELRKKYNIAPLDRFCTFHSYIYDKDKKMFSPKIFVDKFEISISFSKLNLSLENMELYYQKILNFKPIWMYITPSIFDYLIYFLDTKNLSFPETIKIVEVTGEILTDEKKQFFENRTNTKVINHYGSREFNSIAYECPCGKMHIVEKNVFVEIIDKQSNDIGNICVSTLLNNNMPLIRYNLKDKGKITNSFCKFENKIKQNIDVIEASANDVIYIDGKYYDYSFFSYLINKINVDNKFPIKSFQVVFENKNVCFNLFMEKRFYKLILHKLKMLFHYDKIIVNVISEPNLLIRNGKIKYVINMECIDG